MRTLVLLLLLAGAAFAEKPKTKKEPDKFAKAAGEAFRAANDADAKGDLKTALGLYEKAYAISPHPSTIYNIADVQRRLQQLRGSIKSYETYLVMSPDAADRAEVEGLIDQLAKTPGTLIITTTEASDKNSLDLPAAYVLVDGKIEKKPGPVPQLKGRDKPAITLQVPPGEHIVDMVLPLTYATSSSCDVGPAETRYCEMHAEPRIDGNVVISSKDRRVDVLTDRRGKDMVGKRTELPAGKHRLIVKDHNYYCAPLAIEATGGNTVTYAFFTTTEYENFKRCRTFDIKQHRLQFEP